MKLSISCITFNHEKYIGKTILSFLEQKTNFEYNIEIHNDASTDNTKAEIEKYSQLSADKFVVFHYQQNKGVAKNFIEAMQNCKGEYIALCEGDDYWTDPFKLQKQVDFLDKNKDFAGCCHNVQVMTGDKDFSNHETFHNNSELNLRQLIEQMPRGMIATCSLVFRKSALGDTKWIESMHFGDFPLWLSIYKSGPIFGMADYMAVYRKHSGGFTYGFNWDGYQAGYSKFYKEACNHVRSEFKPLLHKKSFDVYYHSGSQFVAKGEWQKALISLKNMFSFMQWKASFIGPCLILGLKLFFYPIYKVLKVLKRQF